MNRATIIITSTLKVAKFNIYLSWERALAFDNEFFLKLIRTWVKLQTRWRFVDLFFECLSKLLCYDILLFDRTMHVKGNYYWVWGIYEGEL